MKKALLIKLESQAYSSIAIVKAFREHFEVREINWMDLRFNNGNNALKVIWETIINQCDDFQPDLIWLHLQVDYILSVDQVKELGQRSFVINYTEDVREDVTIKWFEDIAPFIGLTVFTNKDDVKMLKEKGINNVAYLPVSYNDVWYRPVPKTDKYYGDIIFIGNNNVNTNMGFPYAQERQDMIKFMKEKFGDRFRSFGMGQEFSMLPPAEVLQAYNNAKVVITHNNFKREGYMSDRGMIALGCGAITIHQRFEGIEEIFPPVITFFQWDNFTHLSSLCTSVVGGYLSLDRKDTADYTKQNHSWHERIVDLLTFCLSFGFEFGGYEDKGAWALFDKLKNSGRSTTIKVETNRYPESDLYHFKQ